MLLLCKQEAGQNKILFNNLAVVDRLDDGMWFCWLINTMVIESWQI